MPNVVVGPGQEFELRFKLKWKKSEVNKLADKEKYAHCHIWNNIKDQMATEGGFGTGMSGGFGQIKTDDQIVEVTFSVADTAVDGDYEVGFYYGAEKEFDLTGETIPKERKFTLGTVTVKKP